eukprot:TCONS_00032590-protein
MYVSIGCPANRHLFLIPSRSSHGHDHESETDQTGVIEIKKSETLSMHFDLFGNGEYIGPAEGKLKILSQSPLSIAQKTTDGSDLTLSCNQIGTFDAQIELEISESLCILQTTIRVNVLDNGKFERNLVIIISISFSITVCIIAMIVSFMMFKKNTAKEHAIEKENQARQAELRFLASMKHYQEQMEITASMSKKGSTGLAKHARLSELGGQRKSSLSRRNSSIVSREHVEQIRKAMSVTQSPSST